jgi:uncharacterized protein YaaW (UPF0174 family)
MRENGARIEAEGWFDEEINSFVHKLERAYKTILDEKIEKIKLEEARMKEKDLLSQLSSEEVRSKELELRKERMRLEAVKRKEENELKKQIEEKVAAIKEKAMKLGYQIKEEVRGKEKVMVLVRR